MTPFSLHLASTDTKQTFLYLWLMLWAVLYPGAQLYAPLVTFRQETSAVCGRIQAPGSFSTSSPLCALTHWKAGPTVSSHWSGLTVTRTAFHCRYSKALCVCAWHQKVTACVWRGSEKQPQNNEVLQAGAGNGLTLPAAGRAIRATKAYLQLSCRLH